MGRRKSSIYKPLARCSTKSTSITERIVSSDYTIWYPRVVARYLLEVQRGSPDAAKWARRARMLATGELISRKQTKGLT